MKSPKNRGGPDLINIASPMIGDDEIAAVTEVLKSGMLAQGKKVEELEEKFAEFCQTKHAIATGNGTQALHITLLANGIGPGDEVVTSAFSFVASATSILHTGAKPVFADINPKTFNIAPEEIQKKITPRTKAIMPVHIFGLCTDMPAIREIAENHDIKIIEDACQAHGSGVNGKRAGSFGNAAGFSFYPTKNMTTGEGGMITTNDDDIADKARKFRNHGMADRYVYEMVGYNFRMTDISAAIGIQQLKKLDSFTEARINNARYLDENLGEKGISIPYVPAGYRHVYHQYTIRVQDRDTVITKLRNGGVGSGVYYPKPLHKFDLLAQYGSAGLENSEKAANEVLSLPVHPKLSQDDLDKIVGLF